MFDFLKSSSADGKISERAKSFLFAILPIVLVVAPLFGFEITKPEEGISSIVAVIASVELVLAAVWHAKGWIDRNFRRKNKLGAFAE